MKSRNKCYYQIITKKKMRLIYFKTKYYKLMIKIKIIKKINRMNIHKY